METLPTLKKGSTFRVKAIYKDGPEGSEVATSLTVAGVTPSCDARVGLDLVDHLTITLADQTAEPGVFYISGTAAQTVLWPAKTIQLDIKYVYGSGEVSHTDTFKLPVIERVTV